MELFDNFFNTKSYQFKLLVLISINILLLSSLNISSFDQIINLLISFGVYSFCKKNNFHEEKNINLFQVLLALIFLILILYRSLWLHIGDNFIYLFFPFSLIILFLQSNNINNQEVNIKPILISLLFPISKIIFIPLAIIVNPFSTFFTWIVLNALGFYSVMKGQEIFYNSSGINVTFTCSGAGQIIFCLTAMVIFNVFFPLKSKRLLLIQIFRSILFTFFANVARLFLLTIFVGTANIDGFSIFQYFHGGNGGLLFSFFSMLISCESYKRLYFRGTT